MAGRTSRPGQSVTSRVLAILDSFDISHTHQSLSDIARRTGLPLATAYRLVGELVAWRGLNRRADGRYEIGVRLWEVGLIGPLHLAGHRSVPIISRNGGRLPLHATGVGKALLAHESPEFRREYLARPLARPTRYTIVEPGRLTADLELTVQRGYAVTAEEMTLGTCSVAAPILDRDGRPVAAPDHRHRRLSWARIW